MNTSDTERRAQQPTIWAYRGQGVNIKFLCPRCRQSCQQLGSKLKRYQGLRQRVCGPCHGELSK